MVNRVEIGGEMTKVALLWASISFGGQEANRQRSGNIEKKLLQVEKSKNQISNNNHVSPNPAIAELQLSHY